jgi:hypothetical protein
MWVTYWGTMDGSAPSEMLVRYPRMMKFGFPSRRYFVYLKCIH